MPGNASAQALVDLMKTPTGPDGLTPSDLTAWSIREQAAPAGQERWSRDSSAKTRVQPEVATLAELSAMRYPKLVQWFCDCDVPALAQSLVWVTGSPRTIWLRTTLLRGSRCESLPSNKWLPQAAAAQHHQSSKTQTVCCQLDSQARPAMQLTQLTVSRR